MTADSLRLLTIGLNAMIVGYWAWGLGHSVAAGNWLAPSNVVFALPAALAILTLHTGSRSSLRWLTIVSNAAVGIWWGAVAMEMPLMSGFQAFWASFALVAALSIGVAFQSNRLDRSSGLPAPG